MGQRAPVLVAPAACRDKSTDGASHHHFEGISHITGANCTYTGLQFF